ncbi:MAG: hypothetical protein Ta2B_18390 [Termitinemataceae bacterium]|nr:MAG: hypothetical protein Ta2B_18390 [Termitinemataceae bacterium]
MKVYCNLRRLSFFSLALVFSLSFLSCVSSRNRIPTVPKSKAGWIVDERQSSKFLNVNKREVIYLLPERNKKSPTLQIEFDMLDTTDAQVQQLLYTILYKNQTSANYYTKERYNLISKYNSTAKSDIYFMLPSELEKFNWYYKDILNGVVYPEFVNICRNIEYYLGEQQSIERKYYVIDITKKIRVKRSDIILPDSIPSIERLITDTFRSTYAEKETFAGPSLKSIGFLDEHITLNENFSVGPNGLTFSFDPGDIAPNAMGIMEITLNYSQSESFLTEYGRHVLKSVQDPDDTISTAEETPRKKSKKKK